MSIALIVELFVALLLIVTIAYCITLSRKLQRLKADEEVMRQVIGDLVQATGKAEYSIRALRATAEECEQVISDRLNSAKTVVSEIDSKRRSIQLELMQLIDIMQQLEQRRKAAVPTLPNADDAPAIDEAARATALDRLRRRAA